MQNTGSQMPSATYAWLLVFYPLIAVVIEMIFKTKVVGTLTVGWFITVALGSALWYLDMNSIKKADQNVVHYGNWVYWGLFALVLSSVLICVYLYYRQKNVDGNKSYFITSLVLTIISVIAVIFVLVLAGVAIASLM